MIEVIVADDHPIIRSGLRHVLGETRDITVLAEAATADETMCAVRAGDGAVLLLDLSMPGSGGGLDLLIRLRREWPALRVLVLTMYSEEHFAVRALRAGASGYLQKGIGSDELIGAIRKVASGGRYVSATLAERLADDITRAASVRPHDDLSDREYQVFLKLVAGKSARTIAEELAVSTKTIGTYRTRVLEKLGVRSNAELATYAVRNGLADC